MSGLTKFKGGRELSQFLDSLPDKLARSALRSALRAGAKVIKEEAEKNASVQDGELRDSLKLTTKAKRDGTVSATVYTRLFYAKFVEFGTAAHWIKVRDKDRPGRMTRRGFKKYSIGTINRMAKNGSLVIGGNFIGASVTHPGAQAKPFMRPALDAKASEAVRAVGLQLQKRLNKQGLNAGSLEIESEDEA